MVPSGGTRPGSTRTTCSKNGHGVGSSKKWWRVTPARLSHGRAMRVEKHRTLLLLAVLIIAFLLRLSVTGLFQGLSAPPNPAFPDSVGYARLGQNLATNGAYELEGRPSTHFPPGIPAIVAAALRVTGGSWVGPRVLYCLLGPLACLFVYGITAQLAGSRAALVAAALLAVYPDHFYWSMHFSPEAPGALCVIAAVWLACFLDRRPTVWGELALGALLGLGSLVTPRVLVAVPFLFLLRLIACCRNRLAWGLGTAAVAALGLALTLAPWTYRNYLVSGKFMLVSSHGGSTLLTGNNALVESDPHLRGGWYEGPMQDIPGWDRIKDLPEAEQGREARRMAVSFLESLGPWRLLRLEAMKVYRFATPVLTSPNRTYRLLVGGGWALLLPFLLVGIWRYGRQPGAYGLNAVLLSVVFTTLVFFGEPRYRATISPVLVAYGGLGLSSLLGLAGAVRQRSAGAAGVGVK